MISVEEMFYMIGENEPYPIDGATDDFVEYIMNLDISKEIKIGILYRFNSAIAESHCSSISSTLSAVVGVDRDTVYNQTIESYRKTMVKSAIKYRTERETKDGEV